MPKKGYKQPEEHRKNLKRNLKSAWIKRKEKGLGIAWNKGKHTGLIPKTAFKKGYPSWNKGKKLPQFAGENSPSWKGGLSFEPYTIDWTKTLKQSIRERDHYICQLCGKSQEDRLHCVHHIDYNKKNCNPDNLITLCVKCNPKVNKNRDYWTNYFNKKL